MKKSLPAIVLFLLLVFMGAGIVRSRSVAESPRGRDNGFERVIADNAQRLLADGQRIFRFETFGDEAFWGGTLQLQEALKTVTPLQALTPGGAKGGLGLKVDVDQLPTNLVEQLRQGQVNLDDPAVTLALLKLNAVLGVTGFFDNEGNLTSVGLQCALCHSTVDNSLTFGIGHRLDGWANRDLDVGKVIASAPNLEPIASLLSVDDATVRSVLLRWGPGKFDAELLFDGQPFNPNPVGVIDHGTVKTVKMPGATL